MMNLTVLPYELVKKTKLYMYFVNINLLKLNVNYTFFNIKCK